MTVAVGLIGLGYGEQVLLPALRKTRGLKIAALAASSRTKAREASARLNVPAVAPDWRELVDDRAVQAVAMAVPPALQARIARRALRAKKPLFLEKPLAVTLRDASAIAALARRAGVACAMDFEFPELPSWRRAKRLIDSGRLGRLLGIDVRWTVETYAVKKDLRSWKTEVDQGGAALNNFVSHTFHYLEWFAGKIARLNCRLTKAAHLRRVRGETGAELWMSTRAGVPLSARVSTHAAGCASHEIWFHGSKGTLRLCNEGKDYAAGFTLTLRDRGSNSERPMGRSGVRAPGTDGRIAPVSSVLVKWERAIRSGSRCVPGIEEGLRVQRLIASARRSDRQRKWVNCG